MSAHKFLMIEFNYYKILLFFMNYLIDSKLSNFNKNLLSVEEANSVVFS